MKYLSGILFPSIFIAQHAICALLFAGIALSQDLSQTDTPQVRNILSGQAINECRYFADHIGFVRANDVMRRIRQDHNASMGSNLIPKHIP
jgi:hypothetical protein